MPKICSFLYVSYHPFYIDHDYGRDAPSEILEFHGDNRYIHGLSLGQRSVDPYG